MKNFQTDDSSNPPNVSNWSDLPESARFIADSAVFIMGGCPVPPSRMITVTLVEDEILSDEASLRYDIAKADGLFVEAVESEFLKRIEEQASQTRDIEKLSRTDLGVLAKALEYQTRLGDGVILITDDFSVQNVAARFGIAVMPVAQRIIRDQIVWQKQCIGCFRHYKDGDDCPVCGSPLRRKMKKKAGQKPKTI
ncbi:MAG: NOB1 family endonuclease [Methanimicrococcus sp.]|nr:NOB1 family endonuclease [Methanimicrococcus sp.]